MILSYKFYIGLCVILLILVFIEYFFYTSYEYFLNDSTNEEKQLNAYMTTLSEILCPATLHIMEESTSKYNLQGTTAEKEKKALELLALDAGGPVFSCPVPNDPVNIPVNINIRITNSVGYLYKKINRAINKIQKALRCEKDDDTDEGFEDADPTDSTDPTKNQGDVVSVKESVAKESVKESTVPPQTIKEDRMSILKNRLAILDGIMKNGDALLLLGKIRNMTAELFAIKKAAEENKIQPTCTKNSEQKDAGDINF
jgi:hypothetical protein